MTVSRLQNCVVTKEVTVIVGSTIFSMSKSTVEQRHSQGNRIGIIMEGEGEREEWVGGGWGGTKPVLTSCVACLQRWMELWSIQGCTVDHVKHIGRCQSFTYVYQQLWYAFMPNCCPCEDLKMLISSR